MTDVKAVKKINLPEPPSEQEIRQKRYTWREDRNCLSWWYPRIAGAGVPVPRTHILTTDVQFLWLYDGKEAPGFDHFIACLQHTIEESSIGVPCFLRTGQTSYKHGWSEACYVDDISKLSQHVMRIVEFSEMADMLGLATHVWAVRELLPTRPLFRCTEYGGFPVVRELRVFVDDGTVRYHIPYWPIEALADGAPDRADWKDIYNKHYRFSGLEHQIAKKLARMCGRACGGRWSVDVLVTDKGMYVTDMAVAERSWGYDEERFNHD